MELDRDRCYDAMKARDRRFDGRFFVGVATTGVYCRPICPARLPRRRNVSFYACAAAAERAGARFAVSPGATATLVAAAADSALPWLPGVATASEAMAALERGHRHLKLFPAEAAGGTALLRGLHGPLPGLRFCPTGGITPASAGNYLALPNVACVGGSWLTPADRMAAGDWPRIEALAREASALRP